MPSVHGVLTSPTTGAGLGVWAGRFSFTTGGTPGTIFNQVITDASFTSKIIRASNHILCLPANTTARSLNNVILGAAGNSRCNTPLATMTNNASIIFTYTDHAPAAPVSFYFFVFAGGTNT